MKKILIFLSMALIAMASCTKKDLLEVAYINALEGTTFTPAEVSALGDELTFSFNTNYQWQIRGYSTLGFCSVDLLKGDAGDATIKVKVAPNFTDAVRTAEFDILAGAAVQTVTITQTETNAIDIATTTYDVASEGGVVEVAVSANIDYTVNIPSDITWIRKAAESKAMVSSYIMLQVDPNTSWFPRSASGITVTGKDVEGKDITYDLTVSQAEAADIVWNKTFSADWTSIAATIPTHIAMYDGNLYIANASEVHSVNAADGSYIRKETIDGLTVAPQSMASDDAGNLIFAANAQSTMFTVYAYDGTSVTSLAEYNGANMNGWTIGNVRVVGDVKSNAVVTALAALWGNSAYYIAWQITNGTASAPVTGSIGSTGNPSGVTNGCVSPVSDNLDDGIIFIGYAGSPYALYYCADPAGDKAWVTTYDTGTAGNENYNSISVVEYKGRKYCAIGEDNHFGYSTPQVYLVDITDLPTTTLAYKGSIEGTFGSVGAMDVKLAVDGDALKIFLVDAGYDSAACIELTR